MGKEDVGKANQQRALTELFHLVKSLLPENTDLVTVSPNATVGEALGKMSQNNFSQLPIVAGDRVLGVISYRSLTNQLNRMGKIEVPIGDLPVGEFREHFPHVQPDDKWESILNQLDRYDGVLVGQRNNLEGIVTAMDVLNYLHRLAIPFVVIAEIELLLRRIIEECMPDNKLRECVQVSLKSKYGQEEIPAQLKDMTFNDFIQLIIDGRNWSEFSVIFGSGEIQRKLTAQRLKEVGGIRNDVFHFRREITEHDRNTLRTHRDWLQMKALAYVAGQKELPVPASTNQIESSRTSMTEFASQCTEAAVEFFNHVFQASEGKGYSVEAGKTGYVVKAHLPREPRPIGFIYMFPADQFIFRFHKLPFTDEERQAIRQELLKTSVFRREGDRGVKATVTEDNTERLLALLDWIFLKVEGLARRG